jgi:zinc transport system ATP-binding protein
MDRLGLTPHKHKVFGSLSGGLAQRALLARALLSDPDLLLLDEPTANIDAPSSKVTFEILEQLKGKKTILIVTHDLKTIVERVDRVLCVQGEISSFLPKDVCEHFALGLYHTPLMGLPANHFNKDKAHALHIHP